MSPDLFQDTVAAEREDAASARLAEALIRNGQVSETRIRELRERAEWLDEPFDEILLREHAVSEDILLEELGRVMSTPFVRLAEIGVLDEPRRYVSARIAARYHVVPVRSDEAAITLASPHYLHPDEREQLRLLLGVPVEQVLCRRRDVQESIKHYYGVAIDSFLEVTGGLKADQTADISVYVREIIRDAAASGATDVHFEPTENGLRLRYRIDGVLHDITLPEGAAPFARAITSSVKVMAQMKIDERRLPQDGRFEVQADDDALDIRVSVLPSTHGESVNLRLLKRGSQFLTLEDLGLRAAQRKVFERLIQRSYGMILFTGPTGSGKTTSLYAALSNLNRLERKIVTLEDPVEYDMQGIQQMQINSDIGFTFASGLRSVLRHDPDIVLVGEIRDRETAQIAVSASMTGHLVFSTLHTNDAPSALIRLTDMGVEPYLITSSVAGVVAQRLVRRVCAYCRETELLEPRVLDDLIEQFPAVADIGAFYHGAGCPECRYTGYSGRLALFEILEMDDAVRQRVIERAPSSLLMNAARDNGLVTLREIGWEQVAEGITTVEEVLRVT